MKKLKELLSVKTGILYGMLLICFLASLLFVKQNQRFYKQTIARITKVTVIKQEKSVDYYNNRETITKQRLTAKILNGIYKGEVLSFDNTYSYSGAMDNKYRAGDEVFIKVTGSGSSPLKGTITGLKRDWYVVFTAWCFLLLIIIVGKKKGLYSVISLVLNVIVFSFALDLYIKGYDLLLVCSVIVIIFTIFSLFLVSGKNDKTYSAILSTLVGIFSSLLIAYVVLHVTGEKGMRYEEMQYLTHPPHEIFMAEILVGSLGAIMDITITMASSIFELYDKNHAITKNQLIASGMEIGKDIMGTMINVLFFAYVSGAIPMILLYLKNGYEVTYTFSMNLSLELVRALTGSIGIVLSIPISLYISVFVLDKRRAKA